MEKKNPKRTRLTATRIVRERLGHLDEKAALDFCRWFVSGADRYDYGWLEGGRKRRTTTDDIDSTRAALAEISAASKAGREPVRMPGARLLPPLSQKRVAAHLAGMTTLYYVSRPTAMLAMLDVDWKDEQVRRAGCQSDAVQAARFLASELGLRGGQFYVEPSLGGYGASLFVLVDTSDFASAEVVRTCQAVAPELKRMVEAEGFVAAFDKICGTPRYKGRRGDLARVPRPTTDEGLRLVAGLPLLPFSVLSSLANRATAAGRPAPIALPSPLSSITNGGTPASPTSPVESSGGPATRMNLHVAALFRHLRRAPTLAEALQSYEAAGLGTGADTDGNRACLAERAIAYFGRDFDATKGRSVEPAKYLPLIRAAISEADIASAYRVPERRLLHEDVALGYAMIAATAGDDGVAEVPKDFFVRGSRTLKERKAYPRTLDYKKVAAIKRLLVGAGLLRQVRKGKKHKGCDAFELVSVTGGAPSGH